MTVYVSRETQKDLQVFQDLLLKWNRKINLISRSELQDVRKRHIEDSLQILNFIPENARSIVDLGSGAGFPGLVLAIALKERPDLQVTLIESNGRKCAFLREAARRTGTEVRILSERIERISQQNLKGDVITSRALAALDRLLELAAPLMTPDSCCVFHKGQYVDDELTEASKYWNMAVEKHASKTDPAGTVLVLKNLDQKRQ